MATISNRRHLLFRATNKSFVSVSAFLEFLVLVVEFINATCSVNKFHLTCVEWV